MSSFPCPKCKEPVSKATGRCWHCGWNTASYEEDVSGWHHTHTWDDPIAAKGIELILSGKAFKEPKLTGLSSSYYELPEGCKELQDLIEYKNMNFARGNVFKAAYRLGDKPGTDQIYDWEKIIWFANREIERLKNAEKSPS